MWNTYSNNTGEYKWTDKTITKAHDPKWVQQQENTWENRLRSLQSKLENTKSRKLQALKIQFHRHEHEQIRQEIIDTVSANKQFYSQSINGKFEQHVHNMKQTDGHTNTWSTESKIIAPSKTFNIEIFVQTTINGKHEWIRYSRNSDCDHSMQFKTIRHHDNHFSLIQNKSRPCICTCREAVEGKINHKYKINKLKFQNYIAKENPKNL